MDQHEDFLGQEINIGDTVVFGTPMDMGRGLCIGTILRFTKKMLIAQRVLKPGQYGGSGREVRLYDDQVQKVDPQLVTMYCLKP